MKFLSSCAKYFLVAWSLNALASNGEPSVQESVAAMNRHPTLSSALNILSHYHSSEDFQYLEGQIKKCKIAMDKPMALKISNEKLFLPQIHEPFQIQTKPLALNFKGQLLRLKQGESLRSSIERFTHDLVGKKYSDFFSVLPKAEAQTNDDMMLAESLKTAVEASIVLDYLEKYAGDNKFKTAADFDGDPVLNRARKQFPQKIEDLRCNAASGTSNAPDSLTVVLEHIDVTISKDRDGSGVASLSRADLGFGGVGGLYGDDGLSAEDKKELKSAFEQGMRFCALSENKRREIVSLLRKMQGSSEPGDDAPASAK